MQLALLADVHANLEALDAVLHDIDQRAFFGEARGLLEASAGRTIDLPGTERCLINPGAVGQARNGEPLARYALLDLDRQSVTWFAPPCDHAETAGTGVRGGVAAP